MHDGRRRASIRIPGGARYSVRHKFVEQGTKEEVYPQIKQDFRRLPEGEKPDLALRAIAWSLPEKDPEFSSADEKG